MPTLAFPTAFGECCNFQEIASNIAYILCRVQLRIGYCNCNQSLCILEWVSSCKIAIALCGHKGLGVSLTILVIRFYKLNLYQ